MKKIFLLFMVLSAFNLFAQEEPGYFQKDFWRLEDDTTLVYNDDIVIDGIGSNTIIVGKHTSFTYNDVDAAVNAAVSGDLILVLPGSYSGHIDADVANITIKSLEGPERTTLALVMSGQSGLELNGDGIVIDGFTLTGDGAGSIIEVQNSSDDWIIQNCIINSTGSATMGFSISTAGASDCIVRNNTFLTNSDDGAMWINKTVDNFRIYGNTFLGQDSTAGYAIQCGGGFNNWFIHDNVFRAEDGYVGGFSTGIMMYALSGSANSDSVYIHNNDIAECSKGIYIGHSTMTLTVTEFYVHNNIIHNNQKGIYISSDAQNDPSTFIINANSFYDNTLFDIQNAHATELSSGVSFTESGVDLTGTATNHLLLPSINDAATPTLAFGDGNTGFFEAADDFISVSIGGFGLWMFDVNGMGANNTQRASIRNVNVSATTPGFIPRNNDSNTGIGWAAADQLSLISGEIEGQRISEGDGEVSTVFSGTVVETITDATTNGSTTITKGSENFLSTVSIGDALLIYAGTTAGDYGTYIVASITDNDNIVVDRAITGSSSDVDFDVIADGVIIENSTNTGIATLRVPGYPDYAGLSCNDVGATTIDYTDVWEKFILFATDMPENISDAANATDDITTGGSGDYSTHFSGSANVGAATKEFELSLFEIHAASIGAGIASNTEANPIVITTNSAHGLSGGELVKLSGLNNATELNDHIYLVKAGASGSTLSLTDFSPTDINSTGYGVANTGTIQLVTETPTHSHKEYGMTTIGSWMSSSLSTLIKDDLIELYMMNITDDSDITMESASMWIERK